VDDGWASPAPISLPWQRGNCGYLFLPSSFRSIFRFRGRNVLITVLGADVLEGR